MASSGEHSVLHLVGSTLDLRTGKNERPRRGRKLHVIVCSSFRFIVSSISKVSKGAFF